MVDSGKIPERILKNIIERKMRLKDNGPFEYKIFV